MSQCAREGCTRLGVRVPVIKLAAYPGGAEIEGVLPLPTCEECSKEIELSDVMDDVGFETIALNLEKSGHARPDRSTAQLTWKDVQ